MSRPRHSQSPFPATAASEPSVGRAPIDWRETLPLAGALLAVFAIPWGPVGAAGLRWAWDVLREQYAAAIPIVLAPVAGVLVLIAARVAEPRTRDLLWAALGFLLLGAGLGEAADTFAARGLGPLLLVGAALSATSHRLRLSDDLPRVRRLLPLAALVLVAIHLLWPVEDGKRTMVRAALLWEFAMGSHAVPQGFLAFEAIILYYPIAIVGSAALAIWPHEPGRLDRFLHFLHMWGPAGMLLAASLPHFMYLPPTHATGFLSVAITIAASTQLAARGLARVARRAAKHEFTIAETRPFFARFALTSLSGVMVFLSFPRYDQVHLAWVALLPALFVITDVTPRRAFLWAWWTGLVTNFGGFHWITHLLERFAGLPFIAALPVCLVLCAYNGLVFALWGYVLRRLVGRSRLGLALLAALVFTAVEFLVWELFPWYFGNSQYLFLPILQIADLTGVSGVTFVVLYVSFSLHAMLRALVRGEAFPKRTAIGASVVLIATLAYGVVRMEMVSSRTAAAKKMKMGVVQANIGIDDPQDSYLRKLQDQERRTRDLAAKGADLVILPESALPMMLPRPSPPLPKLAAAFGVPVIFGTTSEDREKRQFNTAYLLERDGTAAQFYDKNYPLLFGEYLPFMDKPWMQWIRKALPYASFLTPGTEVEVFQFRGHKLGIMICYEDILPRFTRRLAGKDPEVLINITNDAWFGRTAEPHHHMALSILRAVENRLYLVRSVRTGVSGFVDATGRIVAASQLERPESLLHDVPLLRGTTVYRELGDVFAYLVLAVLAFVIGQAIVRARREKKRAA
jgi:apolipoprotein N-acyltransferase